MEYKAIQFKQNDVDIVLYAALASELWSYLSVNRKADDKIRGYQRTLSDSRARQVQKYLDDGNIIARACCCFR